jgi:hypothetical protein
MEGFWTVEAKNGEVGVLLRLSAAPFVEDAGARDPSTDVSWSEKYEREHLSGLVRSEDAVCFLAFSGRTAVAYLAG